MRFVAAASVLGMLLPVAAWPEDRRLANLLESVAQYVERYERQLSMMVAEEDYLQTIRRRVGGDDEQRIISDFLFLKLPSAANWVGFRDVYRVDDLIVREPQDRFERILRDGGDVSRQAAELAAESARYNIGSVVRTINVPTLVLGWLERNTQGRFKFELKGYQTISGIRCRVVAFREDETPTLIRGRVDSNIRSTGSFCTTDAGFVWRTELQPQERAKIVVTYRFEPQFQMLVPSEMRETYASDRLECVAKYSKYRQFFVTTRIK